MAGTTRQPMAHTDSFGYWVRRRRMALDLTQRELALQVPCSLATIKKIEADLRRPSPQMAERLAICLGLAGQEERAFLAVALGRRPVSFLALAEEPEAQQVPLDRVPSPGTLFIGRQAEMAALAALLASPAVRLLTIMGPGGIGKTRLAIAAAGAERTQQPRLFSDGVAFVDLAPVPSAEFVVAAIAGVLGLDLAEYRGDRRSPTEKLLDFLRPRSLLLVLDNFEHLLGTGGASLLPDMLQAASRLKILATSRLRLNLREEHLYPLSGMPYPSDLAQVQEADPLNYPAGQLFLASARRVRPDFSLLPDETAILAAICQKLEGMPLALELAAAWANSLSLAGIAAELVGGIDILASGLIDLPERHRSVRSTLDATWRLLQPAERQAFAGLCVFRGGFSREGAEQVADATLPMLAQLISKSLVEFDPVSERYRVHEVLRQYGEEKLAGAGLLAETRQRHLAYLRALAERASDGLFGPDQITWLDRLQAEQDNFRAALAWGFTQPEMTGETADLVIALSWFWRIRSHVLEGREWLDRTLLQPGLTTTQRAAALYHGGHLAWMQDDFELARQREEESLDLWRSMGSAGRRGEAYATHSLGMALYGTELHAQNYPEPAVEVFRTCLDLMREVGDEWGAAFALQWLAFSLTSEGETEPAIAAAQESLASYRRLGEAWGTGLVLGALANLSLQTGDLAQARQYAESAQEWRARVGHRHSLGVGYELLATIAEREDRAHVAAANYRQAATIFDSLGNQPYADKMRDRLAALLARQVSAPS